jgi:hypothetical protein
MHRGHPANAAFTIAFSVSTAVVLIAFCAALAIPGKPRRTSARKPAFAHR